MIWISYADGTMLYTAGTRYEVQENDKKFIVKTFDKDDNLLLELTYKVGEVSNIQLDCGHKDNPLKKFHNSASHRHNHYKQANNESECHATHKR